MATKKETETIEIRPIEFKSVRLKLVGDTPLIMHAWSEKAKRMILMAQQGQTKGKKKPIRKPADEFAQSLYWMNGIPDYDENASDEEIQEIIQNALENGAKFCFPVVAFKKAAISAAYRSGWVKDKVSLKGAFFIQSDENGMVEIKSDKPFPREDMVRIGMGVADLRFRGEFRNWSCDLVIAYNASGQYSLENIINIINAGGKLCGAGEWRPEKDGQYGMYHIQTE